MPPIPCAHCGNNFMKADLNPDSHKLCNNCFLRQELRTNKKGKTMDTIDILIKVPSKIYAIIEEKCMSNGMDCSQYFLSLVDFHSVNEDEIEDQNKEDNQQKKQRKNKKL